MTVSIDTYGRHDDHNNMKKLKIRMRRLEVCLCLAIAAMLLPAISNSITTSSLSARIQDIEDDVFPSLQNVNDRINLLSETFFTQLEAQQNMFSERFAIFEGSNSNKVPNNHFKLSNKENRLSTNMNKVAEKKSTKKNKVYEYADDESLVVQTKSKERKLQISQDFYCASKPILSAINETDGNIYNQRLSKLLEVMKSLSSHDAIHNDDMPQYKAACYILYDDVIEMNAEDRLTVERYILYLFLISTELFKWGQELPSNFCDIEGVGCDNGHVFELEFGKYFVAIT